MKIQKYPIFLFIVFLAVWTWAAIAPKYRDGWLAENYLVFVLVPLIVIFSIYFRLSKTSYTLLTIFAILHVIGSHYTYAETPFGYILQTWLGADRNMYDRLVHLSFGLLLAYPMREVFIRLSQAKGFWSYWFPIELVMGLSGLFEIIEWLASIYFAPDVGLAYVGAQGDIWDAQKDMALATIGSIFTMFVVFIINAIYNPSHSKEFKESLTIPKNDEILGEVKLSEMILQKKVKKWKKSLNTHIPSKNHE
ncbi:DUF2238 domain-containing protein [Candidatus Pacearchaeota archaeon CG10_big_fil_rev_8_21_14_0_10_31_24]|nr:MAG: DUF2238 domain-containing protein [Candidatus Pacearchaeota archaeon CG10_big_fil_rev_8_21_14_0_10_31_24]